MTFGSPTNAARRHTYVPGPGHCVAGIYTSKNHLHSKVSVFFPHDHVKSAFVWRY